MRKSNGLAGRTFFVVLALGLPGSVTAVLYRQAVAYPLRTAVLWASYETALAAAAFLGKVLRGLEERWQQRAVERIDEILRRRLSRFRRRYLDFLIEEHRFFDVKGLTTQGGAALLLTDVFVDLSLAPEALHKVSADPFRSATVPQGRHSIWEHINAAAGEALAVIGPPGSGKTTLLKHVVLTLARKNPQERRKLNAPKKTPIILFLRDHVQEIGKNRKAELAEQIRLALPQDILRQEPPRWLETQLERGCVVLLDGLDEVADHDQRRQVVEWVERQIAAHKRSTFIITSRPFGYRSNPVGVARVLEVRPFSTDQVGRFVSSWYIGTEIRASGIDDPGIRRQAKRGAMDLLGRLQRSPALLSLAVNPLLLTMIANVHRFRSQLPGRRVELYDEICDVFLGNRQQARGLYAMYTPAQKQLALQVLAYELMHTQRREVSVDDAARIVEDAVSEVDSKIEPDRFLKMIEESSGLLLEREADVYAFAHLTFQEYLAARYIQEHKLEEELVTRIGALWWRETIRLYAAIVDASPIVEACLRNGSTSALALAAECVDEARKLRPELRDQLNQVLNEAIDENDVERRQQITEVRLALRLRSMVPCDGVDSYVSPTLITNSEYQLFLDDVVDTIAKKQMPAAARYRPDHWRDRQHPTRQGLEPVLGVHFAGVERFCEWLTEREDGPWRYRPLGDGELSEEYAKDLSEAYPHACIWVHSKQGESKLVCPGTKLLSSVSLSRVLEDVVLAMDDGLLRSIQLGEMPIRSSAVVVVDGEIKDQSDLAILNDPLVRIAEISKSRQPEFDHKEFTSWLGYQVGSATLLTLGVVALARHNYLRGEPKQTRRFKGLMRSPSARKEVLVELGEGVRADVYRASYDTVTIITTEEDAATGLLSQFPYDISLMGAITRHRRMAEQATHLRRYQDSESRILRWMSEGSGLPIPDELMSLRRRTSEDARRVELVQSELKLFWSREDVSEVVIDEDMWDRRRTLYWYLRIALLDNMVGLRRLGSEGSQVLEILQTYRRMYSSLAMLESRATGMMPPVEGFMIAREPVGDGLEIAADL